MRDCFVIMPIGSGDAYQTHRNRYVHIIQPAVEGLRRDGEQVFRCVRADFVTESGSITRDLLGRLYRSDAVLADLTDLNPNVFYELGVRHALRTGTILIALKGTKPPFDVGDLRVIPYEDRVGGEKDAIPQIQDLLLSLLAEPRPSDSPVIHAIPELAELGAVKEHEARISALTRDRELLEIQLAISERTSLANQATLEALRDSVETLVSKLSEPLRRDAEAEIKSAVQVRRGAPVELPAAVGRITEAYPQPDPHMVFVLMPFSNEMQGVFDVIRDAASSENYSTTRADALVGSGSIIGQIYENIARSALLVVDLTGRNPNVMYELGIANTMGKHTIILSQSIDDIPFDVRDQRVIKYESTMEGAKRLRQELERAFKHHRKQINA
jgi:hypothetical protein